MFPCLLFHFFCPSFLVFVHKTDNNNDKKEGKKWDTKGGPDSEVRTWLIEGEERVKKRERKQ